VLEVTGSSSTLTFESLPRTTRRAAVPDIGKARALLGWEPRITLKEGLRKSLDFFKSKVAVHA